MDRDEKRHLEDTDSRPGLGVADRRGWQDFSPRQPARVRRRTRRRVCIAAGTARRPRKTRAGGSSCALTPGEARHLAVEDDLPRTGRLAAFLPPPWHSISAWCLRRRWWVSLGQEDAPIHGRMEDARVMAAPSAMAAPLEMVATFSTDVAVSCSIASNGMDPVTGGCLGSQRAMLEKAPPRLDRGLAVLLKPRPKSSGEQSTAGVAIYLARPHMRHSEWAEEDHLKSAARFCWWGRRTLPHDGRDTRPPPPRRLMGAGRLWREQPQPFAGCKRSHRCPRAA